MISGLKSNKKKVLKCLTVLLDNVECNVDSGGKKGKEKYSSKEGKGVYVHPYAIGMHCHLLCH